MVIFSETFWNGIRCDISDVKVRRVQRQKNKRVTNNHTIYGAIHLFSNLIWHTIQSTFLKLALYISTEISFCPLWKQIMSTCFWVFWTPNKKTQLGFQLIIHQNVAFSGMLSSRVGDKNLPIFFCHENKAFILFFSKYRKCLK